jgi:hypothetical protein
MSGHGVTQLPSVPRPIDVMIVGARKAGTTSLKEYLGAHPEALTHRRPDMFYFKSDQEFAAGYEKAWLRYFAAPARQSPEDAIVVAKQAGLFAVPPHKLDRLQEHNPRCRLIFSVRDPVERAFSVYLMKTRRFGTRLPEFTQVVDEALAREPHEDRDVPLRPLDLRRGRYVDYIKRLVSRFGADRLRVVVLEELQRKPLPELRSLAAWCSLDPERLPDPVEKHNVYAVSRSLWLARAQNRILTESNPVRRALKSVLPATVYAQMGDAMRAVNRRRAGRPEMPPAARARLEEYYAPYKAELEALLGRPLPWAPNTSASLSPHHDGAAGPGARLARQGTEWPLE